MEPHMVEPIKQRSWISLLRRMVVAMTKHEKEDLIAIVRGLLVTAFVVGSIILTWPILKFKINLIRQHWGF